MSVPGLTPENTVDGRQTLTWRWWRLDHRNIIKKHRRALNAIARKQAGDSMSGGWREGQLRLTFEDIEYAGWWRVT